MKTIALIVAAGRGERAGGGLPKQYRPLAGVPVLRRSLQPFLAHPRIDAVRVVIADGHQDAYAAATAGLALLAPVTGGAERQDSVRRGLESLAGEAADAVLIHDAARPFVPAAMIDRVLDALADAPAALPVLPVVDTLKRGADGAVAETVPRDGLWRAQTPQGFRYAEILAAHRAAAASPPATDDAALAERAGLRVALVEGSEEAGKLTTAEDLARAEARLAAALETRVGTGFDVHRIGPGDAMMLGGVTVPADGGLVGHSDADVALHALTDAILGALADGDIGAHFPPSDPQWRGSASDRFLADAVRRVRERGGRIRHLDLTIVCERPKIGPHREAIRGRIAAICGVPVGRVSVKATTTERLGFTGRQEGVAAQAAATLALPAPEGETL
ncbi:bifunctional enzyme IspD/IspF [Thalassobaculum fulvum]|uniref:Bifunctional enzyme IspD/IspF n=1 Tax=Thalassobaculum fulvum TaxID=1633335 RepID=A0A918XQW8_9PROT|nr:bifunctional 2-C-methyl-D-erythritol 4-phosphate cytidylyltransferase/2-C-methyl-D-erythritol 2,4-cyclodiphosphate synthase [Thalassobaculum fulvum]GHD47449.1 bifunctional enzyme IspD/IspF [Thalassobaculum fulvum]